MSTAVHPRQEQAGWPAEGTARFAGLGVLAVAAGRTARSVAQGRSFPIRRPAALRPRLRGVVRLLHSAAAMLGGSVLADSAVEHYRGGFANPGMFAPLVTSAAALLSGIFGAVDPGRRSNARRRVFRTALGVGIAGTGFHLFNILRRPGGLSWQNLFYAAPVGAPAALSLAGLLGLAADGIAATPPNGRPTIAGVRAGRSLASLACLGLAGTVGEAWLLHFRGAFHNPFMLLPVTLPPISAAVLGSAAARPNDGHLAATARGLLLATAGLGVVGTAFHAYGVSRGMGGWRNWSQNLVDGPPLPAPPAFSALALVGLAALALLDAETGVRP